MNEVVKNQIKLLYNPFSKTIVVERLDDQGVWKKWREDPNENWNVSENAALQNVALELLKEINSKYNTGNRGMHTEFFGTSPDFVDLKDILDRLKKDLVITETIEITHNQEDVLPIGEDAKKEVDSHYKKIEEIITSSSINSATIAKYQEVSKPTIKVCVIGNYSTGKSTFLNAIIGKDILPSDMDPTTAKNVSIRHCEEMCICFKYDEAPISILWNLDTNKYKYSEAGPAEFKKKLDEVAEKETDAYRQAHAILKMLNQESDEKLSIDIELRLPFTNNFFSTSEVEYVFIDTPGSNAAAKNSEKHKKTLTQAFEDKTSALPVILVDRESLSSKDNKELNDELQKDSIELDMPNKLFLITKADKINIPTLKKDLNNNALKEVLKERNADCVLYFSALIALGAQTDFPNGSSYQSDYKKNKALFSNDKDEEFRNLEEYAILPDLLSDLRYTSEVSEETDKYLKNSGMLLFQRVLDNFAKKYSYYSKAEACRRLLLEVIKDVEQEQEKTSKKLEETKRQEHAARSKKKDALISEINKKPDFSKNYTSIVDQAKAEFAPSLETFLGGLLDEVNTQWNRIKTKKAKGEEKTAECHEHMVRFCNKEYKEKFNKVIDFYKNRFNVLAEDYKDNIILNIKSDKQLSDKTKDRLVSIDVATPNFSPTYTEYKKDKKGFSKVFLFWGEKINPTKYASALCEDFKTRFQEDCVNKPAKAFKKDLDQWISTLQETYKSGIDSVSIELNYFDKKIEEYNNQISEIKEIRNKLAGSQKELESLTNFKKDVPHE